MQENKNIFDDEDLEEEEILHEPSEEKDQLSRADLLKLKTSLLEIKEKAKILLNLLEEKEGDISIVYDKRGAGIIEPEEKESGQVIEGVFDGQNMIGPDGKEYSVPANYASKSKLVEGDILKLTITSRGSFIFKQIGPVERERLIAKIHRTEDGDEFYATVDGKKYKLLKASVTYFKGEDGDEAVILVPKDKSSTWAAVENVIKK